MTINFYVHKDDLDHLNKLIKSNVSNDGEYAIEVYRSMQSLANMASARQINIYFLVGISYEDFMRIEEFLRFL